MSPDYSGQNLRGRSFKGQDLTGANFSKADIRGANFTNAILKDADFTGAKAGLLLQEHFLNNLALALSSVFLIISTSVSIYINETIMLILNTKNTENIITGIVYLVVLLVFYIITIRHGLIIGSVTIAIVVTIAVIFVAALASSESLRIIAKAIVESTNLAETFTIITKTHQTNKNFIEVLYLSKRLVNIILALTSVVIVAFTGALYFLFLIAGVESNDETELFKYFSTAFSRIGLTILILALAFTLGFRKLVTISIARYFFDFCIGLLFTHFSSYIGWRSFNGYERDAWLRSCAIAFAATGGTSFHGADLTDADFTGATLKNTDFRKANLTRTRFYEVKKLDFARPGNTILSNPTVLNLLITLNGRNKSYIGANLKGANLIGADLKEANLKNADIIEATFQGANLEWANLTLTQAVGTNFTKAQMTGACVEAWNIESTTILDDVDCRFVYLLENPKPRTNDRELRPSSGEFQPGEFTKLFEEVLNTVDLIFRNGIDWKAFITAFKKVQVENQDTELVIQSIENKGDGVVVVKVAVPENANKEKIHSDFTENYQLALAAVEEKYKSLLQAKDERIEDHKQQIKDIKQFYSELVNISKSLADQQTSIENKIIQEINNVNNDSSRKIEIGNIGRDFNASGQALNLGEISGTVINTINELATAPEPDKPGIKELLTQLKTAIETDTDLTAKDKEKALKQVKSLAEAAQNPQEQQDLADTAITMLKGTIANLPTAAKLVEECGKLLPLISGFLGLG
jgi:uncharacterized protein YjbI with pentapeptide repeats